MTEKKSFAEKFASKKSGASSFLEKIDTKKGSQASHMDRIISQKGHLVHKIRAKDITDRWAYYFVLIEEKDEPRFYEAMEKLDVLDFTDYGKIIASCYGKEPAAHIKKELKERYDFDV